jgi:predicted Zn-dependent protease
LRANRQTRELTAARQMSLRGAEALQQKKYGDAESLFSEAIRQSPADERAQSGYAEVLLQKGQVQAATEHMTKAVETSGGNPDLVVRLGQMHLEQGELSSALVQADLALRNQRTHAGAWALKGDVLRQQRQLQDALDCYHRSLIYHSDAPQVQIALAEIYRQMGRPQRALATLNNLADHHSPELVPPRAWLLKGQALADLGEDAEAKRCLRLATHRNAACCWNSHRHNTAAAIWLKPGYVWGASCNKSLAIQVHCNFKANSINRSCKWLRTRTVKSQP